jgi:capsular polysaccharide biosynthesis protein
MANEEDLERRLTSIGFRVVLLSHLPISQQWSIFAGARIVVAPHGAGIANILFSAAGASLVEIYPPNYHPPVFRRLAAIRGLGYIPLEGRAACRGAWSVDIDAVLDTVSMGI